MRKPGPIEPLTKPFTKQYIFMFKPRFLLALAVISLCLMAPTSMGAAPAGNGQMLLDKLSRTPKTLAGMGSERVSNRLIVKYKAEDKSRIAAMGFTPGEERVRALNASGPGSLVRKHAVDVAYVKSIGSQIHVMRTQHRMNRQEMEALTRTIAGEADVEYAEIDEIAYPHFVPGDPDYANQWNLKARTEAAGGANLQTAWGRRYDGTGVVVAVIDTGYRPHADFIRADTSNNIINGYDFVSEDAPGIYITANDTNGRDDDAQDPGDWVPRSVGECKKADSSWHGTKVAGVIAAAVNNGRGMVGVAHGARVLAVRALGVCGGYTSDIAAAMRWAAGLPIDNVTNNTVPNIAKVINMSLGSSSACSNTYQEAVDAVRAAGSVIVASTGNSYSLQISTPANCKGIIAVTAHTKMGDNADYADVGVGTALSAPGGGNGSAGLPGEDGSGIDSTTNTGTTRPVTDTDGDGYRSNIGTSFAAPHVSGVAALLFEAKPTITVDEVMASLVNSAAPHPAGSYCENRPSCGAGLLDAQAAVNFALGDTPFTTATSDATGAVPSGTTVTLTGTATTGNSGSAIASYEWVQISGPAVALSTSASAVTTFVMPTITTATDSSVYFRFRATNTLGLFSDSYVGVQGVVPVTDAPVSIGSDGGGGGQTDWLDLAGLALLALMSLVLRKRVLTHH
jgi:serine protease